MMLTGVLALTVLLVGFGALLGSRISGWWYECRQSEIENELRAELSVLRQSRTAAVTMWVTSAPDESV